MLPGGGRAELLAPYPAGTGLVRLWLARIDVPGDGLLGYLRAHGQPIRYACAEAAWPIEAYQSVFSAIRLGGDAERARPSPMRW